MKSDKQLQKDVLDELSWEPYIDAAKIGVEVQDGIVTLTGHLKSYAEKRNAERVVQRVADVKGVAIEIDIDLPGENKRHDADIAHSVRSTLDWNVLISSPRIHVAVEDGKVTLSGEVDQLSQKQEAEDAVSHLAGVKEIKNLIIVKPAVVAKDIKTKLEAALQRRAHVDAEAISVSVDGNDVTLRGSVRSLLQRNVVLDAVRAAKGVTHINDLMIYAV